MNYKFYTTLFSFSLTCCLSLPLNTLANYYCTNLTEANAQAVFSDIQAFYENNLGGHNTTDVMSEVEAMFDGFNLSTVSNQACDRGELFLTGYNDLSTIPNRGYTNLLFRWQESSTACQEFYGGYLDLFSLTKGDSIFSMPGSVFSVQQTTRGKLFAMNARCSNSQSAYFIIIIDRDLDLTTMPGPGEQGSSFGSGDNSQLRLQSGASNANLSVYPNPILDAPGQIEFQIDRPQSVTLYLVAGNSARIVRTVLRRALPEGRHEEQLDLSMLPPGIYYLILETEDKRQVDRLVKL